VVAPFLRLLATTCVLIPLMCYMPGSVTSGLLASYPILGCLLVLLWPAGVFLHWAVARTASVYSGWVYWLILVASVLLLTGFPVGTMIGGATIAVLLRSDTFQRMRNGSSGSEDGHQAGGTASGG